MTADVPVAASGQSINIPHQHHPARAQEPRRASRCPSSADVLVGSTHRLLGVQPVLNVHDLHNDMGCCGEPADAPNPQNGNRSVAANVNQAGTVNQQPAPQPSPVWQEKTQFQPPNIASPPAAMQFGQNMAGQPQMMQQQQWGQAQNGQFNPYALPTSVSPPPAASATLVNPSPSGYPQTSPSPPFGQARTPPLMQPSAVYQPGSGMTLSSRQSPTLSAGFKAASDEGKLSVAFDFGKWHIGICIVLKAHLVSQVQRSPVW